MKRPICALILFFKYKIEAKEKSLFRDTLMRKNICLADGTFVAISVKILKYQRGYFGFLEN